MKVGEMGRDKESGPFQEDILAQIIIFLEFQLRSLSIQARGDT